MTTMTKTVEITLDNVLELLKAAIDTKGPDYSYRSEFAECAYGFSNFDEERTVYPACVVGQLIHQQGTPAQLAEAIDRFTDVYDLFGLEVIDGPWLDSDSPATDIAATVLEPYSDYASLSGFSATPGAAKVLKAAQLVQDGDGVCTWGEAYAKAVEVHAILVARREAGE